MNINELKQAVLNEWLHIEYYYISKKLGFIDKDYPVTKELLVDTIRCLDHVSIFDKENENYIITVLALMWTHIDKERYDIRSLALKILSRIGYPTSAIIMDEGYDKSTNTFSSIKSPIDKLTITLNQQNNEVYINGKQFILTAFQKRIWDSMAAHKIIGISAPTSAGKSFTIILKIVELLSKETLDVIYIIPTLSLMTQVTEDFNKMLKCIGVDNYLISNTYSEYNSQDKSHIYIMTQEKALAALSASRNAFDKRLILIVDEIQNIERIESSDDERAKMLFDTLTEFRYKKNVEQIIISGPRIQKIERVGKSIFGIETEDVITDVTPVLNLTYSINKSKGNYYFKQYCALTENAISKRIENASAIIEYGTNKYNNDFFDYLNRFINCFGDDQSLIFAPTPPVARQIASNVMCSRVHDRPGDLIQYYRDTVRENYSLCNSLEHGAAYHHGKLPMHVRCTLEKAIANKAISVVACTTTLMQGVNMPAQNIFIRNPHLYIRRNNASAELSNYEMANLRGRAGRLLKDFIGRTFVLDESAFEETDGYDQLSLFDDVEKELPSNYGDKFEANKSLILDVLNSDAPVDVSMKQFGFLINYIRQSVLRYREESKSKMSNVGIKLTKEQVAAIIYQMDQLSIPKEICYKNRYWDPIVLDYIYTHYSDTVPAHPNEWGAQAKLDRMLKFLRDSETTTAMYEKHINFKLRRGKGRGLLVTLCMKWSKETCLSNLLSSPEYDDPDRIEDTIEILQNTVSFRVPLLLKPIFDIKNPNSVFLTCLQNGAFSRITKKLIELGIPRETSISIKNRLFSNLNEENYDDLELEKYIRKTLKEKTQTLPYWERVQFEYLI